MLNKYFDRLDLKFMFSVQAIGCCFLAVAPREFANKLGVLGLETPQKTSNTNIRGLHGSMPRQSNNLPDTDVPHPGVGMAPAWPQTAKRCRPRLHFGSPKRQWAAPRSIFQFFQVASKSRVWRWFLHFAHRVNHSFSGCLFFSRWLESKSKWSHGMF